MEGACVCVRARVCVCSVWGSLRIYVCVYVCVCVCKRVSVFENKEHIYICGGDVPMFGAMCGYRPRNLNWF